VAGFGEFARHDGTGESGTDDCYMSGGMGHPVSLNQWLIWGPHSPSRSFT
jgi:hypothetical protein